MDTELTGKVTPDWKPHGENSPEFMNRIDKTVNHPLCAEDLRKSSPSNSMGTAAHLCTANAAPFVFRLSEGRKLLLKEAPT